MAQSPPPPRPPEAGVQPETAQEESDGDEEAGNQPETADGTETQSSKYPLSFLDDVLKIIEILSRKNCRRNFELSHFHN